MDLQKGLPLTILAVVSVMAVVGLVLMYNADATGMVAFRTYGRAILTEAPKTPYQINTWGQAIKAVKPSNPCYILGIKGEMYEPKDVPLYLSVEEYNDLNMCYPYFDLYSTNTDRVCCVL